MNDVNLFCLIRPQSVLATFPVLFSISAVATPALMVCTSAAGAESERSAIVSAATARPLYRISGRTTGKRLQPDGGAQGSGRESTGRVTPLDPGSFAAVREVRKGDRVLLPLTDSKAVAGSINLVMDESGFRRVAGSLANGAGSFFLGWNGREANGVIQLVREGLAYRVEDSGRGRVVLRELRRSDVISAAGPRQ